MEVSGKISLFLTVYVTSILLFFSAYLTFGHASSRLTRVFQTFQFLLGGPEVFLGFSTRFWVYPRVCSLLGVPRKSLGGIRTRCPNHFILGQQLYPKIPPDIRTSGFKYYFKKQVVPFTNCSPIESKTNAEAGFAQDHGYLLIDNLFCQHFWEALINLKSTSELCSRFTISLKHPGNMK